MIQRPFIGHRRYLLYLDKRTASIHEFLPVKNLPDVRGGVVRRQHEIARLQQRPGRSREPGTNDQLRFNQLHCPLHLVDGGAANPNEAETNLIPNPKSTTTTIDRSCFASLR